MENDFLKLPICRSSKGQGVKVLNRNLRGHELLVAEVGGTARWPASRPLPSRLAAAWTAGMAVERPRPTGSLKGAEAGRAAAWPARKENLLAEAARSPACLPGAPSPRDRPAQACTMGGGRGTLTLLRDSRRNGHSLGREGRKLFPPFRHDPIHKCPMQLPGRTGIFGALNS